LTFFLLLVNRRKLPVTPDNTAEADATDMEVESVVVIEKAFIPPIQQQYLASQADKTNRKLTVGTVATTLSPGSPVSHNEMSGKILMATNGKVACNDYEVNAILVSFVQNVNFLPGRLID
jgi:hypothetical protein